MRLSYPLDTTPNLDETMITAALPYILANLDMAIDCQLAKTKSISCASKSLEYHLGRLDGFLRVRATLTDLKVHNASAMVASWHAKLSSFSKSHLLKGRASAFEESLNLINIETEAHE